jgi:hypothetical protein
MTEQTQKELGKTLWTIADALRGSPHGDDEAQHIPQGTGLAPLAVA